MVQRPVGARRNQKDGHVKKKTKKRKTLGTGKGFFHRFKKKGLMSPESPLSKGEVLAGIN